MTAFLLKQRLAYVRHRIIDAAIQNNRDPDDILLLAVTKNQSLAKIKAAIAEGQRDFGENYVQEALNKITALDDDELIWHFIGRLQQNKLKKIAANFAWVHTVDSLKSAEKLNQYRDAYLPPLNICIQVNINEEQTKAGVVASQVLSLAKEILYLERVKLRGLMVMPNKNLAASAYHKARLLQYELQQAGIPLDTLSMGMSQDLESAVAEQATIVRIGTAIFGER